MTRLSNRMLLAVFALVITSLAWAWFIVCFTATDAAWWNSLWVFFAAFGVSLLMTIVSLVAKGSAWSTVIVSLVCLWSALSFGFISMLVVN